MKNLFIGFVLFMLLLVSCVPVKKEQPTDIQIDYKSPKICSLFNYQDQQLTDSLIRYFSSTDPTHRFIAARAFGSVQDEKALDSLATLLDDNVLEVREAAAFAIGQIGSKKGIPFLVNAFERNDSTRKYDAFNAAILEAVGKCGDLEYLNFVATPTTYKTKDTILLTGQAKSIYRFGYRGVVSLAGTQRMVSFLEKDSFPDQVQFWAANYLARIPNLKLDTFFNAINTALKREQDPRLRMALSISLGKTAVPKAAKTLIQLLKNEKDYRVRCNAIRALGNFEYDSVSQQIFPLLKDANLQVARTAATYFLNSGTAADATIYSREATDSLPWQVQLKLLQASNRHLPSYFSKSKSALNNLLREKFETSSNPYERADCLIALSEFPWNYRIIRNLGFTSTSPVIRTAAVQGIANICRYPRFDYFFGANRRKVRKELGSYLEEAVNSGDVAMIAIASGTFYNSQIDFTRVILDIEFLKEAQNNLPMPQAIETYYEIQKAIAYFRDQETPSNQPPAYNHPIDWKIVQAIESTTKGIIKTEKGEIILSFFPEDAPGSVANFIQLARTGYYDGKNFHRIVPNFVIQGGCPRGDGYGSLNYTIRSELTGRSYNQKGYLGMASAGKHTECTQFFITHSPTPHLDGRYTIFGKVEEGMDVVNAMERGDLINKIEIQ